MWMLESLNLKQHLKPLSAVTCRIQIWQGQDDHNCKGHGTLVASVAGGWATGVAKRASLVSVQVLLSASRRQ